MKSWIILGAFLAALAVIFGAFGAHGLKNKSQKLMVKLSINF